MNCKYCNSANVVKFGTFEGVQRYWCKDCKRKFANYSLVESSKRNKVASRRSDMEERDVDGLW